MIHALEAVGQWLYVNTVGNLAASAIWSPIAFVAGYVIGKRKLGPVWRKHTESVESLHAKLDVHGLRLHELHNKLDAFDTLEVAGSKPKPPSDYTGKAPSE